MEEADRVHFLAMELVEGQPLDRVLPAQGLPVDRIVRVAGAVAEERVVEQAPGSADLWAMLTLPYGSNTCSRCVKDLN